jgi:hypothetical protein
MVVGRMPVRGRRQHRADGAAALVATALQSGTDARERRVSGHGSSIDRVQVLQTSSRARARPHRGHPRSLVEALKELDRVGLDSPDRPDADQLRIEVQQLLMASVRSASVTSLWSLFGDEMSQVPLSRF